MSWNYRILQHRHPAGDTVALHEVFYEEDGSIRAWALQPECGHFESIEELEGALKMMLNDVGRFRAEVLEKNSLPGAAEGDCLTGLDLRFPFSQPPLFYEP